MRDNKRKQMLIVLYIILAIVSIMAIIQVIVIFEERNANNGQGPGNFTGSGNKSVYYTGEIHQEHAWTKYDKAKRMAKTTLQFYETKYSFGPQTSGVILKHTFKFKNTGQNPLLLGKADVTCGCTLTELPEDPIPPGADGEFTVIYNTGQSSTGLNTKTIYIHANTLPESNPVVIEAYVNEAEVKK